MKSVIPFTKELEFATKVSEITSISLEREFVLKDGNVEGNMMVTGEYRSHEVSVNLIPFSFKIPFSIALSENVIDDSVSLEISDFAYDMVDDNKIKVHIELELEFKEEEKDEDDEEDTRQVIDESDVLISMMENNEDSVDDSNGNEEIVEESVEEISNDSVNDIPMENPVLESKPFLQTEVSDEYMTYHIHILKEGETLETLCAMYHVTGSFISEYNDISNLTTGDKILIPFENE